MLLFHKVTDSYHSHYCTFFYQETLEDIDKNGDGHVDEDEYIGRFICIFVWRTEESQIL